MGKYSVNGILPLSSNDPMMCRCYVKPWGKANTMVAMQLTTFPSKNRLSRRHTRQNDKGRKNRKTGRRRPGNAGGAVLEVSDRKHLTGREVERLIEAINGSRNEIRDRCLLLQPGRQWNRSLPTGTRQPHRVG
jgi:hypothetical protein